jgi:hypothetical protein
MKKDLDKFKENLLKLNLEEFRRRD